jgi:D-threo-aldose 1-dehydrogenase
VLASGPKPGAFYTYGVAPPAILERVARIQKVCETHGVKLIEAALRFPLAHPCVVSVIPGGQSAAEVRANAGIISARIPAALWADLKTEKLLRADAPVPE